MRLHHHEVAAPVHPLVPLIAILEAKNDNLRFGLGPCIAAMYASQLFNKYSAAAIAEDVPVAVEKRDGSSC
jgi:hypothetical protein